MVMLSTPTSPVTMRRIKRPLGNGFEVSATEFVWDGGSFVTNTVPDPHLVPWVFAAAETAALLAGMLLPAAERFAVAVVQHLQE